MKIRTLASLSIAALVHAEAAWCQEADELDRWIPSIGLSAGVVRQTASGFQQNDVRPPDDTLDPPGPFPGTPSSGSDSLVDPFVVFDAELMSPRLASIMASPRLFVHGEVGGAFGSAVSVAQEGTPGELVIPPVPRFECERDPTDDDECDGSETVSFPALSVGGQGTLTDVEIGTLMAGAGAGIAFTADLYGRRLRVKPSFEYLRHEVEVTGVLQHVAGLRTIDDLGNQREDWVFTSFNEEKKRTLHSIGGGLELEMDTLRAGPFVIALFAKAQAYRLLGDGEFHLFATDGANSATWDVTLDREIYRGAAGLRFRLYPEQ